MPRNNGNGEAKPIEEVKNAKARRALIKLCAEYRELADQAAALETAKKALMVDIKAHANAARVKKVAGEGWMLIKVKGGSSKISAEKLLEKGVRIGIIEHATVKSEWSYFQVLDRQ
jgi:hypothetical protein